MFKISWPHCFRNPKLFTYFAVLIFLMLISSHTGFSQSNQYAPDLDFVIEDFSGSFKNAADYGEIPQNWEEFGPDVITFSKGADAHHGDACLHARINYSPEYYSGIYRVFSEEPGTTVDLRLQIRATTSGEAQAMLDASEEPYIKKETFYWYPSSSDEWRTFQLDNVEIPADGELPVSINLAHTVSSGESEFEIDCLSSSEQLAPADEPTYDASGEWELTITNCHADSCAITDVEDTKAITINQDGDNVETLIPDEGENRNYVGTVNGKNYDLSNSWVDDGVTIGANLIFSLSSETSGSGILELSFTEGNETCNGTCDIKLSKQSAQNDDGDQRDGQFSQSDLAGTWYAHGLYVGEWDGWSYSTFTIDASGNGDYTTTNSNGETSEGTIKGLNLAADGIITSTGASSFHGALSTDKNMMIYNKTYPEDGGNIYGLIVALRRGGSFSQSDLEGKWYGHTLTVGKDPEWEHSTLIIDNNGNATYSSVDSEGYQRSEENPGKIYISGKGIIHTGDNDSLHGAMSADKNIFVATEGEGEGEYILHVFVKGGGDFENFSWADTKWYGHSLYTGDWEAWEYDIQTCRDSKCNGSGTYHNPNESGNYTIEPDNFSDKGILTSPSSPGHGVVSRDKNIYVYTDTYKFGDNKEAYALSIYSAAESPEPSQDENDDDAGGGGSGGGGCFIESCFQTIVVR